MNNEEKRRSNVRLGLILATVAIVFAIGFFAKISLMGPN